MSSLNLNKVVLCGRLTATPELKQTTNGVSVCSFTLAVNRKFAKDGAQNADFISVIAWRQTAEFITKYFDKGNAICITGCLQTRTWEDDMARKRYATDVVVDEAMFVDGKKAQEDANNPFVDKVPNQDSKPHVEPNFEAVPTDEPLPF